MTNWWRLDQMLGHFFVWLGKGNNGAMLAILLFGIGLGLNFGSDGGCYD